MFKCIGGVLCVEFACGNGKTLYSRLIPNISGFSIFLEVLSPALRGEHIIQKQSYLPPFNYFAGLLHVSCFAAQICCSCNVFHATEHSKHCYLLHFAYFASFPRSETSLLLHFNYFTSFAHKSSAPAPHFMQLIIQNTIFYSTLPTLPASCDRKHYY